MAADMCSSHAVLEVPTTMCLPIDVAVEVFRLLRQGQCITFDWTTRGYKAMDNPAPVTLKYMTVTDFATLQLGE